MKKISLIADKRKESIASINVVVPETTVISVKNEEKAQISS